MKIMLPLVFCALSLAANAQSSASVSTATSATSPRYVPPTPPVPQTLLFIDGFPQNFPAKLQDWLNMMQPVRFQVTEPAQPVPSTINIAPTIFNGGSGLAASSPGTIWFNTTPPSPVADDTWDGLDYLGFTHEMMHQSLPPSMFGGESFGLDEGIATGKTDLIYLMMRRQNPSLFPVGKAQQPTVTCAPAIDMYKDRKILVFGGADEFYENIDNEDFSSTCSLLALFINKLGGNYRSLDHAINTQLPTTRAKQLAMLDGFGVTIDGVKPSTFFNFEVTNFKGAPQGKPFFGIVSAGGYDANYTEPAFDDNWPFNPGAYFPFLVKFQNPYPNVESTFNRPQPLNSSFTATAPTPMVWSITDASGKLLVTRTADANNPISMWFGSDPVLNATNNGNGWFKNYSTGAYLINACITQSLGSTACVDDPNLKDSSVFAIVNEELDPGDVAVIVNGPHWNELAPGRTLTLLSPDPSSVTIERYPDLAIFRHLPKNPDGSFADITVTDGTYIRTFTPDEYAPTLRTFKDEDQPLLLSFARATDFVPTASIAPGGLYSLMGAWFSYNDPVAAEAYPISTKGCPGTATNDQGETEVIFTAQDGTQYPAPILYCGQSQLNIEAPLELPMGQTVTASVVLNGISSKSGPLTVVAADPASFGNSPYTYYFNSDPDPITTWQADAIFATGAKAGQLVTASNPARPGDILSLYVTGLGSKAQPLFDGMPMSGANPATGTVIITAGGTAAQVLYAGCAPGYAGLDQINFVVPSVSSGTVPLTITEGDTTSPPVMLATAAN